MIPSGIPMSSESAANVPACHATSAKTCRRKNPIVLRMAISRRRRGTQTTMSSASTPAPRMASTRARN